jgi:hypothetical protein
MSKGLQGFFLAALCVFLVDRGQLPYCALFRRFLLSASYGYNQSPYTV